MNADERRLNEITERVIKCAYRVSNKLGCGFLGKVLVGEYIADLVVEELVLVELKAVRALDEIHVAQYLKATSLRVALLINFARQTIEIKRVVLDL